MVPQHTIIFDITVLLNTGKDLSFNIASDSTFAQLAQNVQEHAHAKIKLFYMGKLLDMKQRIDSVKGIQSKTVIQAMVV